MRAREVAHAHFVLDKKTDKIEMSGEMGASWLQQNEKCIIRTFSYTPHTADAGNHLGERTQKYISERER